MQRDIMLQMMTYRIHTITHSKDHYNNKYLHLCQVVGHQQTPCVRNVHRTVPEQDGKLVTAAMVKTS